MFVKLVKSGLYGLGIYTGYAFVSAIVLLHFNKPKNKEELDTKSLSSFYGKDENDGPDTAAFFDSQDMLLTLHLNLIESAKNSIKFANFSIEDGTVSDLFYGKLLEAADRGVNVNILFDGKGHNLVGISNGKYWALIAHPNIQLAFYEEFDWLRPWTWQNRMHDKFLIADDHSVLTGGVNLEDSFFVENHDDADYDRDVVIINNEPERFNESVLKQYTDYYDSLWYHPYTHVRPSYVLKRYEKLAKETRRSLLSILKEAEEKNDYGASTPIDWHKHMFPTRKVSLVTNPIQRWKKDPHILATLGRLFKEANDSIIFQSPYVVPSKDMQQYVALADTKAKVFIATNSLAASNNFFGVAGHRKYLKQLSRESAQIYHFQGEGYIHAKAYSIDSRLSLIGSFNFDPRSSFLSQENLVIIDSPKLTVALEDSIKDIARKSIPYNKDGDHLVHNTSKKAPVARYKKVISSIIYVIFYPFEDLV
ncbi:phospholipase D-like domain-containing protein [Alkalibacterium sp. f15]|uniref:phospholipase D-like domain-containing protein n=1 Tax=Alkalibacterium sp. f15 TaxID=3414029 RepID=UPI003BF88512